MAVGPALQGDWLRAGQPVDLVGAYRPDMRKADDRALQRACSKSAMLAAWDVS